MITLAPYPLTDCPLIHPVAFPPPHPCPPLSLSGARYWRWSGGPPGPSESPKRIAFRSSGYHAPFVSWPGNRDSKLMRKERTRKYK